MMHLRKWLVALIALGSGPAGAQTFAPVPFQFTAGVVANASQVMADYGSVINNGNAVATALSAQINALMALPSGALVFYYLTVCPSGWSAVNATWNNLFVRGLDAGAGNDPDAANAIGYVEAAGIQTHTHGNVSAVKSSNGTGFNVSGSLGAYSPPNSEFTDSNFFTAPAGAANQVPINVVLLLCVKN